MTKTDSITWLLSLTCICLLAFLSTWLLQHNQFDPGSLQGLCIPAPAPLFRLGPQPGLPSPSHTAWPIPRDSTSLRTPPLSDRIRSFFFAISYCISHPWGTSHSLVFLLSFHGCVLSSQQCWNQRGYTIVSQCLEGCLAHTGTSLVKVAGGEHRASFRLSPWMRVMKRHTSVSFPLTKGL